MMYEIVMEESYNPQFSRPYQSETVIRTMLEELDAQLECAERNINRRSHEYFYIRAMKEAK